MYKINKLQDICREAIGNRDLDRFAWRTEGRKKKKRKKKEKKKKRTEGEMFKF